MWSFFHKIKRAIFGKSHQTSISEKILENRISILNSFSVADRQGLTAPKESESKKKEPISPTEVAHYFIKDGLDIPGQVSTYFSEVGIGASSEAKVDVASLLGLNIKTPKNFPISAKVGLEAEVGASVALSGAKGSLLFIEYQPDIAEYKANEHKEYTPVCFGALTGGKANLSLGVSASVGLVAEASVSVEPFEALEISAFSASAKAFSVEAEAEYAGTCFKYTTTNLKMYPRIQDSLFTSVAKDISDVIDKKQKISTANQGVSDSVEPNKRQAIFQGWLQTGSAAVKGSLFSLEFSQGGISSALEGWYKVSASLLKKSVEVLAKSWNGELKRLAYTLETPARGNATIKHQVKVDYTMTQSSLAVCVLQLSAGNVKTELFGENEDDTRAQQALRSGANFYSDILTSKVNEKASSVCPVFYNNEESEKQVAINNAMTYKDLVSYLDRHGDATPGSGLIRGQSINLDTLKRFVELDQYYSKINFLIDKSASLSEAMKRAEPPKCNADALTAMKQAITSCFGENTQLMSGDAFKEKTDKSLRRASIKPSDIALETFHDQYLRLKDKLEALPVELSDSQVIKWGVDIDLLLGLLGTIEDNLVLWALEKGKSATNHKRADGIRALLKEIDQEKSRIYNKIKNILYFKELYQIREVVKGLSKVLNVDTSDILTFLLYNRSLITDLTLDPGAKPEAVLIESAHTFPLEASSTLAEDSGKLESMRLRYRIADREKTETTLFKLGFSICDAASASISLKYFDQYKSEGIVNLSTYWFGEKEKFNTRDDHPEHFVPPAVLITE